jgi:molecular chaperone HtpG
VSDYFKSKHPASIADKIMTEKFGGSKPVFEVNPSHALVEKVKEEQDDDRFADITNILFDQAILSEGGQLDDPTAFVHKLNGLLQGLLK